MIFQRKPQRGDDKIAQGEALGKSANYLQALKGRNPDAVISPFQGLRIIAFTTQGFTLGYFIVAPLGLLCVPLFLKTYSFTIHLAA